MDISSAGILSTNSQTATGLPIKVPSKQSADQMTIDENLGKIIMYMGASTSDLTNGSLYIIDYKF